MPTPFFQPVIGSGFDQDAAQQAGWAGFNNGVERQNIDSRINAINQRNNYFRDVAGMNREDSVRAQQAQEAAQQSAENRAAGAEKQAQDQAYQQNYFDLEKSKIAATLANKQYEDNRAKTINDAAGDLQAVQILAGKGHFKSRDEIAAAIPQATKLQIDALWDANETNRQQVASQYQFSGDMAKQENLKNLLNSEVAKGAPDTTTSTGSWWNPLSWGTKDLAVQPIDASWYDALKNKAATVTAKLAPYDTSKGAAVMPPGLMLDPVTGQYKSQPIEGQSLPPSFIPQPTSAGQFQSIADVTAAFKAGKLSREQAKAILQQQFGAE